MPKLPIDLDALLTLPECAEWMKLPVRVVGDKARAGQIPKRQWGYKTIRFWPREILESGGGKMPVSCGPQLKRTKV